MMTAKPQTGFRLFPNPASSAFSLQWNWFEDGIKSGFTVEISDINGKPVFTEKVEDYQRNNLRISTGNWIAGAYLVKLVSGDRELYVDKVIVKP